MNITKIKNKLKLLWDSTFQVLTFVTSKVWNMWKIYVNKNWKALTG
jgi:hypothetical protein